MSLIGVRVVNMQPLQLDSGFTLREGVNELTLDQCRELKVYLKSNPKAADFIFIEDQDELDQVERDELESKLEFFKNQGEAQIYAQLESGVLSRSDQHLARVFLKELQKDREKRQDRINSINSWFSGLSLLVSIIALLVSVLRK